MTATRSKPETREDDPREGWLTVDDYMRLDDDQRYQLVDGELIVSPAPLARHQAIVVALSHLLYSHVRGHGLGRVFVAPFDVVLGPHTVVQPDVLFIAADRLGLLDERNCKGPPTLCCEVLSPSTRALDLGRKRANYEASGVPNLWLIEPEPLCITELVLEEEGYRERSRSSAGVFEPACPVGCRFELTELLAE